MDVNINNVRWLRLIKRGNLGFKLIRWPEFFPVIFYIMIYSLIATLQIVGVQRNSEWRNNWYWPTSESNVSRWVDPRLRGYNCIDGKSTNSNTTVQLLHDISKLVVYSIFYLKFKSLVFDFPLMRDFRVCRPKRNRNLLTIRTPWLSATVYETLEA